MGIAILVLFLGGFFILYLLSGILFQSAGTRSQNASDIEYLKVLTELRRNPDSKALQSEARYLGRNSISFIFGRQGREPSNKDFEAIEREIEDAINGREFRRHGQRK